MNILKKSVDTNLSLATMRALLNGVRPGSKRKVKELGFLVDNTAGESRIRSPLRKSERSLTIDQAMRVGACEGGPGSWNHQAQVTHQFSNELLSKSV